MIKFFKVKKAVKNVNPLSEGASEFYDEIGIGGLKSDERAIKICYQNAGIDKLKTLTTESTDEDIIAVLNKSLLNMNGFFIWKNINDVNEKEYYCYINIEKNETASILRLTCYNDKEGEMGFKIELEWITADSKFKVISNPNNIIATATNTDFDFNNLSNNGFSLPNVALLHKWEYTKKWYGLQFTSTKQTQYESNSEILGKYQPAVITELPTLDEITEAFNTKFPDKQYNILSMDFSTQKMKSAIIINGRSNPAEATTSKAERKFIGFVDDYFTTTVFRGLRLMYTAATTYWFRIFDVEGNKIKYPKSNIRIPIVDLDAAYKLHPHKPKSQSDGSNNYSQTDGVEDPITRGLYEYSSSFYLFRTGLVMYSDIDIVYRMSDRGEDSSLNYLGVTTISSKYRGSVSNIPASDSSLVCSRPILARPAYMNEPENYMPLWGKIEIMAGGQYGWITHRSNVLNVSFYIAAHIYDYLIGRWEKVEGKIK